MVVKGRRVVNVTGGQARRGRRWIYGYHAVARRLDVNPGTVIEVAILVRRTRRSAALRELAAVAGIGVTEVDEVTLRQRTGTGKHQGVAALAEPMGYRDVEDVVVLAPRPILVLDGIQDPHNLGALIRTAAAAGMAGVILPRHGQAEITPAVEKAAAGAVNDVALCQVGNLRWLLERLHARGFWTMALDHHEDRNLFEAEIPTPVALVVGGEGGLRRLVAQTCDLRVSIPMRSGVESLNVSVAAAVAMYELLRRSRS
jgi:23S rRNA (guanosine2251-2'-O)-methyltransferase